MGSSLQSGPQSSSVPQRAPLEATALCRLFVLFCVLESEVRAPLCLAFSVHFDFERCLGGCVWSELMCVSCERTLGHLSILLLTLGLVLF